MLIFLRQRRASLRKRRVLFIAGVGLACAVGSASAQSGDGTVYVSVVNRAGAPVTDLTAQDFIVRENNLKREVFSAVLVTQPTQMALIVDNSQASGPFIADVRRGLSDFLRAIGDQHEVALIGIGQRPTILVDYTRDPQRLAQGVTRLFSQTGSGAYLMDGVSEAVQGLRRRENARRELIVISTEGPEFSSRFAREVLDELRQSGVIVDAFVLTDHARQNLDVSGARPDRSPADLSDQNAREREVLLSEGPALTGGRREDLPTSMALGPRLRDLASELNHQYRIVYDRPSAQIPRESVAVTVKRPELRVLRTQIPPK